MRPQIQIIGGVLLTLQLFGHIEAANFTSGSEEFTGRTFTHRHGMNGNEQIDSADDHSVEY